MYKQLEEKIALCKKTVIFLSILSLIFIGTIYYKTQTLTEQERLLKSLTTLSIYKDDRIISLEDDLRKEQQRFEKMEEERIKKVRRPLDIDIYNYTTDIKCKTPKRDIKELFIGKEK